MDASLLLAELKEEQPGAAGQKMPRKKVEGALDAGAEIDAPALARASGAQRRRKGALARLLTARRMG